MDNLNIYLLFLLGGMIIGGWLIGSLFPSSHRYMHYHPQMDPHYYYPRHHTFHPRMGIQVLLIGLAFIVIFSLMVGWQRQANQAEPTVPTTIEQSTREAAISTDSYTRH